MRSLRKDAPSDHVWRLYIVARCRGAFLGVLSGGYGNNATTRLRGSIGLARASTQRKPLIFSLAARCERQDAVGLHRFVGTNPSASPRRTGVVPGRDASVFHGPARLGGGALRPRLAGTAASAGGAPAQTAVLALFVLLIARTAHMTWTPGTQIGSSRRDRPLRSRDG
jgi:hypothetical protein